MVKQIKLEDKILESLPGVGSATKSKLNSLGIFRITDLLLFLPQQLIDKSIISEIDSIQSGDHCVLIGVIDKIVLTKGFKKNLILTINIKDKKMRVRFIHKTIIYKYLKVKDRVRLSGIVYIKGSTAEMIHPEIEVIINERTLEKVIPLYNTKKVLGQKKIRNLIKFVLDYVIKKKSDDIFNNEFLEFLKVPNYIDALRACHNPINDSYNQALETFEYSRRRFVLEELISRSIRFEKIKVDSSKRKSHVFRSSKSDIDKFIKSLSFKLTNSQALAVDEIINNLKGEFASTRLIQGDVGCGKTIISVVASFASFDSGLQTAFLAPTEILVDQHVSYLKNIFSNYDINIATLKNNLKKSEKDQVIKNLYNGNIDIVVGTHSLINANIKFNKLGLCVIDEQHKFGINQRLSFSSHTSNSNFASHVIYLSATPIPRSLSLVLYQGLDYTCITEKPKNRQSIVTEIISSENRDHIFSKIRSLVSNKEKVFWVCPSIYADNSNELESVYKTFDILDKEFKNFNIGILHGQLNEKESDFIINDLRDGSLDILICTTVIEVGIDIPDATCIVIEDANRFGLSQLHQLRGRVGRSEKESYCFLLHKGEITEQSRARLSAIKENQDGFKVAESDLAIRGSGDYLGSRQSGHLNNYKLATMEDFINNIDLIKQISPMLERLSHDTKEKLLKRWDDSNSDKLIL